MEKLIELAAQLLSGAVIAVLASWLTTRSRNRADRQAETAALQVQADAMTVAIMELQGRRPPTGFCGKEQRSAAGPFC